MKILVITGPPYSGKGTQCELLKHQLGFNHISTGDRIRLEKEQKTSIGKIMSEYEEKGNLVPDSIMKDLLGEIIDENLDAVGIILDGYPRTEVQVDTLLDLVKEKGKEIQKVINIEVPKEELLIRAKKRAETSDRKDDKDSQIHFKRIEIFEQSTRPAIEYMKKRMSVVTIDGLGQIADITARIKSEVNASL
ncbi:adenylate kinase family protein [Pseudochryseolinea flava]|uniref:Adenylate kinase n=1 Tax=Pseudochryseolinea flava TaxID=2059302 RepID=A0A364Y4Z4_9BACT|nr:nucleoside monophosphate kinase [Pseudochryseolinea flava]RAW01846.1 adenylate kinase [Pseudochryseolinea flava]